jgi:hypothetical protein
VGVGGLALEGAGNGEDVGGGDAGVERGGLAGLDDEHDLRGGVFGGVRWEGGKVGRWGQLPAMAWCADWVRVVVVVVVVLQYGPSHVHVCTMACSIHRDGGGGAGACVRASGAA